MKIVAEGVPLARLPGPATTQRLLVVLNAIVGPPVIVGLGVSPAGLHHALTVSVVFTVFFFPFDRVIAQLIVYGALGLAPHGLSGFANQCAAVTSVEALVIIVKDPTIGIVIVVPILVIKEGVKPVCAGSGIGCIRRTGKL